MSTGPRTAEGKAISSQNATKHGLTSRTVVTKDESQEEYEAFRDGMLDQYQPASECEIFFVNEIVDNAWRLKRAHRIEAGTFDLHTSGELSEAEAFHAHAKAFDRVRRYIVSLERAMYRAIKELNAIQGARIDAEAKDMDHDDYLDRMEAEIARRHQILDALDAQDAGEFVSQNPQEAAEDTEPQHPAAPNQEKIAA